MEIKNTDIWYALDKLATTKGISLSRMAILSDLDPTVFNKSKRVDKNGKPHWVTMGTLVAVLKSMDISWTEFADYFPPNLQG